MKAAIKNYDMSFLYGKADYGNALFEYIIKSERINKSAPGFENIRYLINRNQTTSCLSTLLNRDALVLMLPAKPMYRSFKVLAAKDVKEDKQTRVFVDVSEIIKFRNNEYTIKNADVEKLVSLLACALNTLIYHTEPTILTNNVQLISSSTEAFAKLATNIIDYMRIGGVDNIRGKMLYLSSMYYQIGILMKENTPSVRQKAIKISKLTTRDADNLDVMVPEASYTNIDTFIAAVARVLRVEGSLKVDNFVDKWIFLYGSGTQFATEIYTAFGNLLINAFVGAYLNNQNQIEKVAGRSMVEYCNTLFKIGGDVL